MTANYRDEFKKEIVGLYNFGFATSELAEMSGVSRSTILRWVQQFNGKPKPVGATVSPSVQTTIDEIMAMREIDKSSWMEIGDAFNISPNAARKRYRSYKDKQNQ